MVSIKYHVIIKTPLLNPNPISSIQSSSKKKTHTHTHEHTTCSFLWSSAFYAFRRSVYRRLGSWSEHHTKATEWTAAVKKSTFIIDLCFGSKSVFFRDVSAFKQIKCFHFAVLKLQFLFWIPRIVGPNHSFSIRTWIGSASGISANASRTTWTPWSVSTHDLLVGSYTWNFCGWGPY